jgi:GAF domain-containing protein
MAVRHVAHPSDADEALQRLARSSLRETSMEGLLQIVAEVAKQVMPGDPETSVLVVFRRIPTTVVYTGRLAIECDDRQVELGSGPGLHAAGSGELTEIADARAETRWPDYARQSAERGALGSLSVPVPMREGTGAALNVYARTANAFDEESRSLAVRLAPYAAVAIANMQAYQDARGLADDVQTALASRAVIDQATGVLMERHDVTADRAFQMLARTAMEAGTTVRDVAEHLVRDGGPPPG